MGLTQKKRRILLISYHFPPSLAARGLQLGKLVKYVLKNDVEIDVVTTECDKRQHRDAADFLESSQGLNVYRCQSKGSIHIDRLSSLLITLPFRGWANEAIKAAVELVSSHEKGYYQCRMTCAHPMDSHRVGLHVKARFPELPWVAHFSDPWATNPLFEPRGPWQRPLMGRYEKKVMRRADRVIFVCQPLLDFTMREYPDMKNKCRVLHHVFDPDLYAPLEAKDSDSVLRITYAGGLSKKRNILPLLKVIENMKAMGADFRRLAFEFVGENADETVATINEISPGLATSVGKVGYRESLRYMQKAGCLLIIDANLEQSPYFPSKVADYFGAGVPILGISPSHSCTTAMLRELNMPTFDYEHLDQCANFLNDVIKGNARIPSLPLDKVNRYSANNVAKEFVEIIDGVR